MKITLTDEQIEFLKYGSKVVCESGNWYFSPYWYRQIENGNEFEVCSFEHFPTDLIEAANKKRNG